MAVTLTKSAAERVRGFMASKGEVLGLRLSVKKTGCSGFAYEVNFAEALGANDHVFESEGVKVIVDDHSLAMVDGTEIDFQREGMNAAFRFNNPKVKDTCGCGESFTV
jgi:iron-sulfur cluster assembly protein